MLYSFLISLVDQFSALNVFRYLTFRTGLSVMSSMIIVFLGDMLELGKKSKKFHIQLSKIINKSDIDKVFVYGRDIKTTFNYLHTGKMGKIFNNLDEAYIYLGKILKNNDLLMIKGSNATGLNQFSKNIKKEQISAL